MKPFEIFRTGRHTSSQGATLSFSDGDLAAIVAGYDTSLHHAPIVVGHPKQDAPAYGWIDGLAIEGDRLVAKPADVDTAFSDLVRDKKFRKVSAAFYEPNSPNNPTPGAYYLRHVGFLGAQPPAVKGLKPIEFAEDDLVVVFADTEFSDWRQPWAFDAAARLFRGIRDYLIQSADVETADRVLPDFDINQLAQTAAEMRAEDRDASTLYSDPNRKPEKAPTKGKDMTQTGGGKSAEQRAAELDEREQKIAAREQSFAERETADRARADAAFVKTVVEAGRLPIGLQATATALFADLGEEELTFADGDETKKTTPRAAFRELLEKLPVQVETGELAKGDALDFSDADAVAEGVRAEIKAAADKGETLSPAAAAARLQSRSK